MRVTVVGAGIVGASVAYHLARAGVAVTVLERGSGPAGGVTGGSFAWVGDRGGEWQGGAEDLRPFVRDDFRRLDTEVAGFAVQWTGSLSFPAPAAALGPGQFLVTASDISVLEPGWREPPERAVYTPTDGGVDPVAVVESLLDAARGHGAEVVYGATAMQPVPGASCVPGTPLMPALPLGPGTLTVLAAGADTVGLCRRAGVGLEIGTSPACLVRVAAPAGMVRGIVAGSRFEVREVRQGELLMTIPCAAGQALEEVGRNAEEAVRQLGFMFDGGSACRLLGYRVYERPMPARGPVVGYVTPDRSLYVAVMHAAITLGPTVGRLIAEEIVSGVPREKLARCRPSV